MALLVIGVGLARALRPPTPVALVVIDELEHTLLALDAAVPVHARARILHIALASAFVAFVALSALAALLALHTLLTLGALLAFHALLTFVAFPTFLAGVALMAFAALLAFATLLAFIALMAGITFLTFVAIDHALLAFLALHFLALDGTAFRSFALPFVALAVLGAPLASLALALNAFPALSATSGLPTFAIAARSRASTLIPSPRGLSPRRIGARSEE